MRRLKDWLHTVFGAWEDVRLLLWMAIVIFGAAYAGGKAAMTELKDELAETTVWTN